MFKRSMALTMGIMLCAAAAVTGAMDAAAATQRQSVQAWITETVTININGSDLRMPNGKNILNYDGQIFLPVRFIAEVVGGTVRYDADYARVYIYTPQPTVEYVEVPRETYVETLPEHVYVKAPAKRRIADVVMNVYGIGTGGMYTSVYFDIKNENGRYIQFDLENAYLEFMGIRYKASTEMINKAFKDSVTTGAEMKDLMMHFERIPDSARKVTVVIPILTHAPNARNEMTDTANNFNMDIDFND